MKERIIRMDMYDEGREDEREEMIFDMLKRGKTVDEIVDAFRFCIDNPFVNGSMIEVNGGYSYK